MRRCTGKYTEGVHVRLHTRAKEEMPCAREELLFTVISL